MQKLESRVEGGAEVGIQYGKKPGTNPHTEKVWKREAHKQKLAEADDELVRSAQFLWNPILKNAANFKLRIRLQDLVSNFRYNRERAPTSLLYD